MTKDDKMQQRNMLEKQIIGSCLMYGQKLVGIATGILTAASFKDLKHQKLFAKISEIYNSGVEFSYIAQSTKFDEYAKELFINFNDLYNESYFYSACMTLKECEIEDLFDLNIRKINNLDGSVYDKIKELEIKLGELHYNVKNELLNTNHLLDRFNQFVAKINAGKSNQIFTGINNIDDEFGAFQAGELSVIAARTSVGKTAFALSCILNQLKNKKRILLISREMSAEQIMLRLFSMYSEENLFYLRGAKKFSEAMLCKFKVYNDLMKHYTLYIDLCSNNEMLIYNRIKDLKNKGLDAVYIDYIGLLNATGRHTSRVYEIGQITSKLKQASVDFDIPVICLAQINREGDDANKPPTLKHLRDSGSIENDADMVAFIHRPNKNKPCKIEQANYIVAKMRQGVTGQVTINFIRELAMFKSYNSTEF